MALKNKMDLSLEIAVPEVFAVMSTVWITAHIVSNGESNWIEGAQLLSVYSVAKSLPKGFNPSGRLMTSDQAFRSRFSLFSCRSCGASREPVSHARSHWHIG